MLDPRAPGAFRRSLRVAPLLERAQLPEGSGVLETKLDIQAKRDQHDAHQEGNAPAPGEKGLVRHRGAREQKGQVRQDRADRRPGLRQAAIEAALPRWRALAREQHGACPLATDRETLHETQHDQEQRREGAGERIRGQAADQGRRYAHHQQCRDERALATEAIAEMAKDHRADRTRDEPDREGAERRKQADERRHLRREEDRGKDQGRRGPVEEEVVPLDAGRGERGQGDLADRSDLRRSSRMRHPPRPWPPRGRRKSARRRASRR